MKPSYIELHERGELTTRAEQARAVLAACTLCPRRCGIDRSAGEEGHCLVGPHAEVASAGPHFGEEAPLVGRGGSGTVFLSSCNLRCVFCQNHDISQEMRGQPLGPEALGRLMAGLQIQGCHNINFVTPTHQVPAILEGLVRAVEAGLSVPLVYNSSGYESVETLRLLEGVFDIYMPDLKTLDSETAQRYMNAPDYPEVVKAAIREMHRQVGDLVPDSRGIAVRGLLVRHLGQARGVRDDRRGRRLPARRDLAVDLPEHHEPVAARRPDPSFPEIDRAITGAEFEDALRIAAETGMQRLD